MKNSLELYIKKVVGKNIDIDNVYNSQCVDLIKHYTLNVMKVSLGTFGGSAKTGWENKSNTFPEDKWIKIENDYTNPEQVPEKGDIIFFDVGIYGHVGIVLDAVSGQNEIKVLDQNTGDGDGVGDDDRTRVNYYSYENVLGWCRNKDFWVEYNGLPVFVVPQPKSKPNSNATYFRLKKVIAVYPRFLQKDDITRKSILEHEYAHHIWHTKVPSKTQKIWEKISNFDESIELLFAGKYKGNAYVGSNARKNIKEDFAECWERFIKYGKTEFGDYRDVKLNAVCYIMNKYTRA